MQSNALKLATFAVAVLGLINQAFVFFGYVPPVPLDKLLHLSTEQLTIAFSFAIAFVPEVHKLGADVLAMLGGIINRDSAQANARYEALAQDFAAMRGELDKLKAPPAQSGHSLVGFLLGLIMLCCIGFASIACLPGCTTPSTAQQSVYASCVAYERSLTALTPLRAAHRLSTDQIAAVDQAVAIAGPICSGPIPADTADALAKLSAAVASMAAVAPAPAASK